MEFRRSRSATKLSSNTNNPYSKYEVGEMLGQGQFGKVYKAYLKQSQFTHPKDPAVFALKIIPMGKVKKNPKLKQLLTNEIQILTTLNHPNIIKFTEIFACDQKIFMVYEYCEGGSLEDMLPLPHSKALPIFSKIIQACSLAEQSNILHRDLKPANILFKGGEPRVADWGFSRYLREELTATSFVGSPAYMAPELLNGSEYTNKADVWSFGVMLYQCLFNQLPWSARNIKELLAKLRTCPLSFPDSTDPILKTILKMCLQIDPQKRVSFQKLQKTINTSRRVCSTTEAYENPQQSSLVTELSQSDIRKCSSYLEFAKHSQIFKDNETKVLCLDLILLKLKDIRNKHFLKPNNHDTQMTPSYSQRKMTLSRRQMWSPNTTNRSMKRETPTKQYSQTQVLLNKEIALIEKIRGSIPSSSADSASQKQLGEKQLIKQMLKKLIKSITLTERSAYSNTAKTRGELIEMNCILQIIMYDEMQEGKDLKLKERIKDMQELNLSSLMRMVNCRVLYVNQHYCRN